MIGTPVALHAVTTPAALAAAAQQQIGLTSAVLKSLPDLWKVALRWNDQYDSYPVFVGGPQILTFPCDRPGDCQDRMETLGAERFVASRMLMPLNISVFSARGLRRVELRNGRSLYRRFLVGGEKRFYRTLLLDGEVQKNLVLIVEDTAGDTSIGYAHRNWKVGQRAPVFCVDHINDCTAQGMLRRVARPRPANELLDEPRAARHRGVDLGARAQCADLLNTLWS
jgi:hypothetical protein